MDGKAKAADGNISAKEGMKGYRIADCMIPGKLHRRYNGWGHMGDACFTAKAETALTVTGKRGSRGGEGEYGTVQATAFNVEYIGECFHDVSVAGMVDRPSMSYIGPRRIQGKKGKTANVADMQHIRGESSGN